jgi:hypothetical protein
MNPTRSFSSIAEHQAITSSAGKSHPLSASRTTFKRVLPARLHESF